MTVNQVESKPSLIVVQNSLLIVIQFAVSELCARWTDEKCAGTVLQLMGHDVSHTNPHYTKFPLDVQDWRH
jgi:hypothetical protein